MIFPESSNIPSQLYCPKCGNAEFSQTGVKNRSCHSCGFTYFHNAAAAVGGVLMFENELLLAERKFDPAKGLFDFPGGFVDYDESLETALTREIAEELHLQITTWQYLFSSSNRYLYKDVTYYTSDIFFGVFLGQKPDIVVSDDVASVKWFDLDDIDPALLAFDSVRQAVLKIQQLRNQLNTG